MDRISTLCAYEEGTHASDVMTVYLISVSAFIFSIKHKTAFKEASSFERTNSMDL